ncbi:MAG TPA: ATP-binding protein [Polyangiaceae bacterium]|jgi:PAS domain S-box-containing protein
MSQKSHDALEPQRWLATTLRSIGDAVIATDAHGRVTMMNPVAEQLTGRTLAESRGKMLDVVMRLVSSTTRKTLESPVARVLREGLVAGLAQDAVLLRSDGQEIPIADSAAPIREDDGTVHGVVLVFRDASAEKVAAVRHEFIVEATAALASSLDYHETLERLAELVVPRLADWCVVHERDDSGGAQQVAVAHVDPRKREMAREYARRIPVDMSATHGAPAVMRTGRSELYPEISDELVAQMVTDPERRRLIRDLELRSTLIVPIVAGPVVVGAMTLVFAESGRRYSPDDLAFAEELGRRAGSAIENARLYGAEQRAREAADAASRAKDDFIAAVSHELRTPLTAILGWSKMMNGASLDANQQRRASQTIERNAVAMSQLVEDLLDVSRIVSGKMRIDAHPLGVVPVVDAAMDSVQAAADGKQIRLVRSLDANADEVLGDARRLQQIVWNVVSNAVKFTPRGGEVRVAVRTTPDAVEISVSDDGRGIEPRFLPCVFEPFRQADGGSARMTGGLGLGLAITKHLVEMHGGTIDVASEGLGKGATFTVRLPRLGAPSKHEVEIVAPPAPRNEPQLSGLRVLMVDDEPDARDLVRAVLEHSGSIVRTAPDVRSALDALRNEVPDVLLSDIGMPGESGYDLIRQVRALPPERGGDVPAAALTAYVRPEDRRKVLGAGFMMHVPKPVDPAELVAVVAALARSSPHNAA